MRYAFAGGVPTVTGSQPTGENFFQNIWGGPIPGRGVLISPELNLQKYFGKNLRMDH